MEQYVETDRFVLLRRLGAGSFGVVYEAFDHERQARVALKIPHESTAMDLVRFKQEFRFLVDVAHPNLIRFFELIAYGQDHVFTMELVEGRNFLEHLRGASGLDHPARGGAGLQADLSGAIPLASALAERRAGRMGGSRAFSLDSSWLSGIQDLPEPSAPGDYGAVRILLRQLADGLCTLHQGGHLHGDIKPTNVLVGPGERLVLLDFGLAVGPEAADAGEGAVRGTPAYMAPELIGGQRLSEASDWYAAGVMLYQVLTGRLPFPGNNLTSVINKMRMDPPSPRTLLPETPADLDGLCMELLRRKPDQRPLGAEILDRLGGSAAGMPLRAAAHPAGRSGSLIIGREQELALLGQAYETSQQGKAVAVFVSGPSGIGKSYLLRRYLHDLRRDEPRAVVLQGRCFEQESLPYRGLDSLLDALSQYLKDLPPSKIAPLLPRNIPSLARLFPALLQVRAIAEHPGAAPAPDPLELRRRAFSALRELLCRLGDRYPLVLSIEDLQWGDPDSSALLASLFRGQNPPSMLLLASYRSEEDLACPSLRRFREQLQDEGAEMLELSVSELGEEDGRRLAMALLATHLPDAREQAGRIAQAARGNPFFIAELSRSAGLGHALDLTGDLEGFLMARVASLPQGARVLLETLALAGHPLEWRVLERACGMDVAEEALVQLRAGHLIRIRGALRQRMEIPHERIRQSMLRTLGPARMKELHLRLAEALEADSEPDAQALMVHYQAAGCFGKAAACARMAADQAVASLAFERAAKLYQSALSLGAPEGEDCRELRVKLGDTQSRAGFGLEAARNYLLAVTLSTPYEALRLQRRAAEELFRCGHFDEGLATLEKVMGSFGLRVPRSPFSALASALGSRLRLRIRGLGFRERRENEVPQEALDRIDTCWAITMGLAPIDHVRGGDFHARQLMLTLDAGETFRIVRALAHETIYTALRGTRSLRATHELQAATLALAERLGHPNPLSRAYLAAGTAALMQGRWGASVDLLNRAEGLLRENCTGLDYELHIVQHHSLLAHRLQGNLREMGLRLYSRLQAAREKGDLLAITNLCTSVVPYLHLAHDEPARALREVEQAIAGWSSSGFHVQHGFALNATVNAHLYEGRPEAAWKRMADQWPALRRSMLFRTQVLKISFLELRARTALAQAANGRPGSWEIRTCLKEAHHSIHALEKERTAHGDAQALKLQAMEALVLDRPDEACALFFRAEVAFQSCDMGLDAAVVRWCRGHLEGPQGLESIEAAEKWMRGQGIVDPGRFTAMHLPVLCRLN